MITDMTISNTNTSGGCGLRFYDAAQGRLTSIATAGFISLDISNSGFGTTITGATVTCPYVTGSTGIYTGETVFINTSVTSCDVGLRAYNVGFVWLGGRFEVNNYGMILGENFNNDQDTLVASSISGFECEGNATTCVLLQSVNGLTITSAAMTGAVNEGHVLNTGKQTLTAQYCLIVSAAVHTTIASSIMSCNAWAGGIDLTGVAHGGNVSFDGVVFIGNVAGIGQGGSCTSCSITTTTGVSTLHVSGSGGFGWGVGYTLSGAGIPGGVHLIDGPGGGAQGDGDYTLDTNLGTIGAEAMTAGPSGQPWNLPPTGKDPAGVTYIGNNGLPSTEIVFADLPGQAGVSVSLSVGMQFDVSDSQVQTLGLVAFGNGGYHVRVQYSSAGHWVIIGTNMVPVLFSTLPTMNQVEGEEFNVTDCTIAGSAWGGAVTGGGGVHCKARWNGSGWTATGK